MKVVRKGKRLLTGKGVNRMHCRLCVWSDGRCGCQLYGERRMACKCRHYSEWGDGWSADSSRLRERIRERVMRWLRRVWRHGDVPGEGSAYVSVLVDMLEINLRRVAGKRKRHERERYEVSEVVDGQREGAYAQREVVDGQREVACAAGGGDNAAGGGCVRAECVEERDEGGEAV